MKLFRSLLLVGLSVVGVVSASEVTGGYLLSKKRPSGMENMPVVYGCEDFVNQAANQLEELSVMIQQKRNMLQVARFATKADSDRFIARVTKEIKDRLQQVKTLINKAEKEAHVAL